jgi:hypothetical protein
MSYEEGELQEYNSWGKCEGEVMGYNTVCLKGLRVDRRRKSINGIT